MSSNTDFIAQKTEAGGAVQVDAPIWGSFYFYGKKIDLLNLSMIKKK